VNQQQKRIPDASAAIDGVAAQGRGGSKRVAKWLAGVFGAGGILLILGFWRAWTHASLWQLEAGVITALAGLGLWLFGTWGLAKAKGRSGGWVWLGLTLAGSGVVALLPARKEEGPEVLRSGAKAALPVVLLAGLVLLVFSNSFISGMTLDNKYIIEEYYRTLKLKDPKIDFYSWEQVKLIFQNDYWWPKGISGLYRPITTFTYWLSFVVWDQGTQMRSYHWINNGLHWLNAVLVYVLFRRLTGRTWLGFFAGAIFAAHPLTVESVTNVIGRADLFACLTAVGGLLLYMSAGTRDGWRRVVWLIGLAFLTAFGVFAKESAVAVAGLILAYDLSMRWDWSRWREWFRVPPRVLLYLVVALGLVFLPLVAGKAFLRWYRLDNKPPWDAVTNPKYVPWIFEPASYEPGAWNVDWNYVQAGFMVLLGLAWYLGTMGAGRWLGKAGGHGFWRAMRWLAPVGALLAAIGASFHVWWMGVVLTLLVGWIELGTGWCMPFSDDLARRRWSERVRWTFMGWYALLPGLIAMFIVRAWVFDQVTPPETPFLDNPVRGISEIKDLQIPNFAEQLARKPVEGVSLLETRMTAVGVAGRLAMLLVWPVTLSSDYSWHQIPLFTWNLARWSNWQPIASGLWILATLWIAWRCWRQYPVVTFCVLAYWAAYFPTSNFTITIGSIMAERFMYLPLVGFAGLAPIAVAWMVAVLTRPSVADGETVRFWDRLPVPAVTACLLSVITFLLGVRAYYRNPVWENDRTLWHAAAKDSPKSFRSYQSLAFALYEKFVEDRERGVASVEQLDEVYLTAEKALPILDVLPDELNSSRLYLHLGMYYQTKGDLLSGRTKDGSIVVTPQAVPWFRKSAAILERAVPIDRAFNRVNKKKELKRGKALESIWDAGLGPLYTFLGVSHLRLKNYPEALSAFMYARQLDPSDPDPYLKIALVYGDQNRMADAIVPLLQAVQLDSSKQDVWAAVINVYNAMGIRDAVVQTRDPQTGSTYLQLNDTVPQVRADLLLSYRDWIRVFRKAKRWQMADQARKLALERYQIPPTHFDGVMAEPLENIPPVLEDEREALGLPPLTENPKSR
jgi:tetratricopeptide (TPR) repeat protein